MFLRGAALQPSSIPKVEWPLETLTAKARTLLGKKKHLELNSDPLPLELKCRVPENISGLGVKFLQQNHFSHFHCLVTRVICEMLTKLSSLCLTDACFQIFICHRRRCLFVFSG